MKISNNLNNSFYNDLNTNFEQAFEMSEKNFSHLELLDMLQNGNIPQRQIAALKYDYIKNEFDAKAILENLTGCDGKIREAAALSINRILGSDKNAVNIVSSSSARIFADATIDINANICRLVVDSAILLKNNFKFAEEYVSYIVQFIHQAFDEIDKFIFRDKKYVINKQIFKLYWCLEALNYFYELIPEEDLKELLEKASKLSEYTVREKAAQIVQKSGKFESLKEKFISDENYYVRNVFERCAEII